MTASACSSAAKSGTSVGPHAASDGWVRGSSLVGNRRTTCPPVPRKAASCVSTQPVRPVSTMTKTPPPPDCEVPPQVRGDPPVAELEQPVEHAAGKRPSRDGADRPKRQRVFDVVDERRLGAAGWLDPMGVLPALERPGHLHVGELLALDEVSMQGFPPRLERPSSQLERQAAAVADPAVARDDAQVLPGRCEPLERARTGVPGKQGGGGSVDDRSLLVNCHVSSSPQRLLARRIARIWRAPAKMAPHGQLRAVFSGLMLILSAHGLESHCRRSDRGGRADIDTFAAALGAYHGRCRSRCQVPLSRTGLLTVPGTWYGYLGCRPELRSGIQGE